VVARAAPGAAPAAASGGAERGPPGAGGAALGAVGPRVDAAGVLEFGVVEGARVQELSDMASFPRGVAHPAASESGGGASLPDDGFGLSGDTGSLPRAGDRKPPYGPPA
jgi:hypothetical protein